MSRFILVRALFVALVAALAVLPGSALGAITRRAVPRPLLGQPLENVDVCGVHGRRRHPGVVTDKVFFDARRQLRPLHVHGLRHDDTHTANGKSVVVQFANQFSRHRADRRRGGGHDHVRDDVQGATREDQDAARRRCSFATPASSTFADTFDLATVRLHLVARSSSRGRTPMLDSDFTLFCEVIVPALT